MELALMSVKKTAYPSLTSETNRLSNKQIKLSLSGETYLKWRDFPLTLMIKLFLFVRVKHLLLGTKTTLDLTGCSESFSTPYQRLLNLYHSDVPPFHCLPSLSVPLSSLSKAPNMSLSSIWHHRKEIKAVFTTETEVWLKWVSASKWSEFILDFIWVTLID